MTEKELRLRVVETMFDWKGATKGSKLHKELLAVYNGYRPLARGYALTTNDNYCAATVSAAWIATGCAPYTGTECSCGELIRLAKARGIWIEADDYVPSIGDALIYAWKDSGAGDNVTGHDHVGIVAQVQGRTLTIIEGNMSGGTVGTRSMTVNGRYIRGYICPDYRAIAAALSASPWAAEAAYWAVHNGIFLGDENGDMMWQQPMTREQATVLLMRLAPERDDGGLYQGRVENAQF